MPNYPYISGSASLVKAFDQLRQRFPSRVDAAYLKRFEIARANESYLIAILKFLQIVDDDGAPKAADYFYRDPQGFQEGLEAALRSSYAELFEDMGDAAFEMDRGRLTTWFRNVDKTTDLVGTRQAATFSALTAISGHGEPPTARARSTARKSSPSTPKATVPRTGTAVDPSSSRPPEELRVPQPSPRQALQEGSGVGLTVRIEVNLPSSGDAETYDAIFASIKKHLMS